MIATRCLTAPLFSQSFLVSFQKDKVKQTMGLISLKPKQSALAAEDLLVQVGRSQDRAAFRALFDHFAPRIKSFLMKSGAQPDQAEEIAQETMMAVWGRASSYDPKQAAASTWIFTIARNKRVDALRKTTRAEPDMTDPFFAAQDIGSTDDRIILQDQADHLRAALRALPKDQADLLHKSFFEDKSHADIAIETRLPLGTVKSRIRLAVEKLRQSFLKSE